MRQTALQAQQIDAEERLVSWDDQQKRMLRHMLEADGLQFLRYFFRLREGAKAIINWHHEVVQYTLDRVLSGEINRLIINLPPGCNKTELAVITFIARGLAINPRSKYIHTSGSQVLVEENSSAIRSIVKMEEYQELWPMPVRSDKGAVKKWFTEQGGGMLARPAGSSILGFRAGRMEPGFHGAFICDDPVTHAEAASKLIRSKINAGFNRNMRSRLAVETVPMVLMMQRIHEEDMTGFLLKGGSGDMWHHLVLPSYIEPGCFDAEYNPKYTHGIPLDPREAMAALRDSPFVNNRAVNNLSTMPDAIPTDAPLWPGKRNREQLKVLEKGDPYVYSAEHQQRPAPLGGGLFKDSFWKFYDVLPPVQLMRIYCDTAQKAGEHNDYSVFQCWAYCPGYGIYLIDQARGKWEAPELEMNLKAFWEKHKPTLHKRMGASEVVIEDKSSGSSLIQSLQRNSHIPVRGLPRNKDKVFRAQGAISYFASGYVYLPKDAPWVYDYMAEFRAFTPLMNHAHDDQIDPTLDAVEDILILATSQYNAAAL